MVIKIKLIIKINAPELLDGVDTTGSLFEMKKKMNYHLVLSIKYYFSLCFAISELDIFHWQAQFEILSDHPTPGQIN